MKSKKNYLTQKFCRLLVVGKTIDPTLPGFTDDNLLMAISFIEMPNEQRKWPDYLQQVSSTIKRTSDAKLNKKRMQPLYMKFRRGIVIPMRKLIATVHPTNKLPTPECTKCLLSSRVKCGEKSSQCNRFNIKPANLSDYADIYGISEDDDRFSPQRSDHHIWKEIEPKVDRLLNRIYCIDDDEEYVPSQEENYDVDQFSHEHIWTGLGLDSVKETVDGLDRDQLSYLYRYIRNIME